MTPPEKLEGGEFDLPPLPQAPSQILIIRQICSEACQADPTESHSLRQKFSDM